MNPQAKHTKVRFGVFHELLVTLIAVSIIPTSVVWFYNYYVTKQRLTEQVTDHLGAVSNALSNHVDDWMEMNIHMLQEKASEPAIKTMDPLRQKPNLKLIPNEYPWVHSIISVAPDGRGVSRSDDLPLRDYRDRDYFQKIMSGESIAYQVLIGKTSGLPAFTFATPITGEDGTLKGILAASVATLLISESVTNAQLGDTGYAFLLDDQGKVIAHQSKEYTKLRKDFSKHPAVVNQSSRGDSSFVYDDEKGDKFLAVTKRTKHGWILVTQRDYDEAYSAVAVANRNAIIMLLATLVVVIVVALILSRRLTQPILRLTAIANEASLAHFDALNGDFVATDRKDEVGELARAVERLAVSLRVAIQRLQKLRST